jgi:hypothetical protein
MSRLRNIWVNPKARLLQDKPQGDGEREAVLEVGGMLCEFG